MDSPQAMINLLYQNIARVIVGKKQPVLLSLATLICGGHLLIEDVPGLGKTMLARAISRSLALEFKRIQCTPDLVPTDITGVSIFNQRALDFEFVKGPVFTNLLLADEINRATPRTQASLLECMAEKQVTAEGKTHALPDVFMVLATQKPVEFHGTYPLPEAQLDRFFMRISMGYPAEEDEIKIMSMQNAGRPIDELKPILTQQHLLTLQAEVADIHVSADVQRYIAAIVRVTRDHPEVELGASPRGSIALMKACQAAALIAGKEFATPQMVKQMAVPVLAHRLILKQQSRLLGKKNSDIMQQILNNIPVPTSDAAGSTHA